ncbi:MAG: V-type ATP synthase subunit D [Candidatus Omnitrophica bacterium]|nr:V-type ATP synthase subunit D [Candidatus Omnitrophota bacterium]
MAKLRLTKNQLKKEKESLKRYRQYLPTLQLKKQQLQMEVSKRLRILETEENNLIAHFNGLKKWIKVFSDDIDLKVFFDTKDTQTTTENIAGIDVPIFEKVNFETKQYDLVLTPFWIDEGIKAAQEYISLQTKIKVLKKQVELIREELRTTNQRVNLFEKVKIPDTKENIRKIQIFLGDMRTAEVVTGKIAKQKIEKKQHAEVI